MRRAQVIHRRTGASTIDEEGANEGKWRK